MSPRIGVPLFPSLDGNCIRLAGAVKAQPQGDQPSAARDFFRALMVVRRAATSAFHGRLAILGEPETTNQRAQHRAYQLLRNKLGGPVLKTKRRLTGYD